MKMIQIISNSEEETFAAGKRLGTLLHTHMFVALMGDLGAGKTVLVRGICASLGVAANEVRSPSFTLVNRYSGTFPLYHIDLYRLEQVDHDDSLGLEDILIEEAVVLMEWADRMRWIPEDAVRIQMEHVGRDVRKIKIYLPEHSSADLDSWSSVLLP